MSKTRDDYRFVLAPWEHRGAQFDARPDLVATAKVGGFEREFLLKAKRNILFFREADKSDEFLCALSAPLTQSVLPETELRAWMQQNAEFVRDLWRGEIEQETYARCVVTDYFHDSLEGLFLLFFQTDGNGWVREPWDEGGFTFKWKPAVKEDGPLLYWASDVFPSGRSVYDATENIHLAAKLDEREMPQKAIEEHELQWICGSLQQLQQLVKWITHNQQEIWAECAKATFHFQVESEQGHAALRWWQFDKDRNCQVWNEPAPHMNALCDLALDFNTPVGIKWEFCDGSSGDPPIRGSWEPLGPRLEMTVEAPSFHEQLEARLELRAWLQGKASAEQIEDWLQT